MSLKQRLADKLSTEPASVLNGLLVVLALFLLFLALSDVPPLAKGGVLLWVLLP
jgi:uncharacterized membrane protein YjgN (DUF898 family)